MEIPPIGKTGIQIVSADVRKIPQNSARFQCFSDPVSGNDHTYMGGYYKGDWASASG